MQGRASNFLGHVSDTVAKRLPYIEWAVRLDRFGLAFFAVVAMAVASLFMLSPPFSNMLAMGAAAAMARSSIRGSRRAARFSRRISFRTVRCRSPRTASSCSDLEGCIIYVSEVGRSLIEAKCVDDLVGIDWLGFVDGADARIPFDQALDGESTHFSGACHTFGGAFKWWTSSFAPVYGEHGKVTAVLCQSRDITAEVNLIDKLRGNARVQKDMEDHVDAVFWTASADFRELLHVSWAF